MPFFKNSKLLLFWASLLLCSNFSLAQRTLKIRVIDGYSNQPVSGASIFITSKKGKIISQGITDESGSYSAGVYNMKVRLRVETKDNLFLEEVRTIKMHDGKPIEMVYLYPNQSYEDSITKLEDELYGIVPEDFGKETDIEAKDTNWTESNYKNGPNDVQNFIFYNVIYPPRCIEERYEGLVLISFIVEPDGKLSHFKVKKANHKYLGAEALRVTRLMKEWTPARYKDEPARILVNLPINFNIIGFFESH